MKMVCGAFRHHFPRGFWYFFSHKVPGNSILNIETCIVKLQVFILTTDLQHLSLDAEP